MKNFKIQAIKDGAPAGALLDAEALFDGTLWDIYTAVTSGYIVDRHLRPVAIFTVGQCWRKINNVAVRNRMLETLRHCGKRLVFKRPFVVMWPDKQPGFYSSLAAVINAVSRIQGTVTITETKLEYIVEYIDQETSN